MVRERGALTRPNTLPIPLASAVLHRGQRAWSRIKSTAAEQRQLWREVGEALLYGRRLNKADRAFSAWCAEHGFGDMKPSTRSNALWLAENWIVATTNLPTDLTHPDNIRQAHRETQAAVPPSPDLDLSAAIKLPPVETVAPIASKVNKLVAMAEAGAGQESETATPPVRDTYAATTRLTGP